MAARPARPPAGAGDDDIVLAAGDAAHPERLERALEVVHSPEAFLSALTAAGAAGWIWGVRMLWGYAASWGLMVDPVSVVAALQGCPGLDPDALLLDAVNSAHDDLVRAALRLAARPDAPLLGKTLRVGLSVAALVWPAADADVRREASCQEGTCSFAAAAMVDAPEAAVVVRLMLESGCEFDEEAAVGVLLYGSEEAWGLLRDSHQPRSVARFALARPLTMARLAFVAAEAALPAVEVVNLLHDCSQGSDAALLHIMSDVLQGIWWHERASGDYPWNSNGRRLMSLVMRRRWARSLVWLLRMTDGGHARPMHLRVVLADRAVDDETKVEVVGMVTGALSQGWVQHRHYRQKPRPRGYLVGLALQGGSGASVVEALLRRNVPVTALALHWGLGGGEGALEAALLAADPRVLRERVPGERHGRTLLELAAEFHSPGAVRALLAAGAPVTDAALRSLWRRRRSRAQTLPFATSVEWGDPLVSLGGSAVAEAGWPITAAAAARCPDVLRCPGVVVDWTAFWGSKRAAEEFVRRCGLSGDGLAGRVGRLPAQARRVLIELLV